MENDMLSSLLNDPETLQNAMKTVSDLLGGQPFRTDRAAEHL